MSTCVIPRRTMLSTHRHFLETRSPQGVSSDHMHVREQVQQTFWLRRYVESLETRLEKMEKLLNRVREHLGPNSVGYMRWSSESDLVWCSYVPTPTFRRN